MIAQRDATVIGSREERAEEKDLDARPVDDAGFTDR